MSDLISREALLRDVLGLTIVSPEVMNYANAVAVAIENAPSVDAEPVRQAKVLYNVAIEKEECNGYKKRKGLVLQKYTCASCYAAIHEESKFCMECGAKLIWREWND